MANDDYQAWVKAQAGALYDDLRAREAAETEAAQPTVIEGDHYGVSGGTHIGDITFTFKR
ncbi:hypothetical protein [Streptomyces sp. SudanB182_2057]|uniref:hypothetical protein n=1 Tax=Streptomyces sp. SudanB182_2057 TaxID=3035281 RepID=UPI003F559305